MTKAATPWKLAPVALGLLLSACGSATDPAETQLAADGSEAMMASSQSTSLSNVVLDAVDASSASLASTQLVSPGSLFPWSCVKRSLDGTTAATVDLTLDDCAASYGLTHVDGGETVTFVDGDDGGLTASIVAVSLSAAGKPIEHTATLDVTFPSATDVQVIWQGSWARTNEAGAAVVHNADLEVTNDRATGCRTLDGTTASEVATRALSTVVTNYHICRAPETGIEGCPTGTVVHTSKPSGRTVTTSYDGSSIATVTGAKGDTFEISVPCNPL